MSEVEGGSYSPEQAHDEANIMSGMVGDKGEKADYEAASQLIIESQAKAEYEHLDWLATVEKGSNTLISLYQSNIQRSNNEMITEENTGTQDQALGKIERLKSRKSDVEGEAAAVPGENTATFVPSQKIWFTSEMLEGVFWNESELRRVLGEAAGNIDVGRVGEKIYTKINDAIANKEEYPLSAEELPVYRAALVIVGERLEREMLEAKDLAKTAQSNIQAVAAPLKITQEQVSRATVEYNVALAALGERERALGAPGLSDPPTSSEVAALSKWRQDYMTQLVREQNLRGKLWPRLGFYDKWAMFFVPSPELGDPVLLNGKDVGNYVYARDVFLASNLPGTVVAVNAEGMLDGRIYIQEDFNFGTPQFPSYRGREDFAGYLERKGIGVKMQSALRGR